ncbi:MAG: CBS domain-containing protein [Verrucomicrobia bacterium]|nr:CBS domain-containing protein [Verrucomicrobiota bacterium]MDA1068901.1 CBS domain-containing protein [Verrucomicrobiota bacterium]
MELRKALEQETVANVGHRKPVAVQETSSVREAVNRMRQETTGCLLVVNGVKLSGIFTERDLLTKVIGKEGAFDLPITEFMTPNPTVANADEPIHKVLTRMQNCGIRHLPIINAGGLPVGMISVRTVVHFLADYHPTAVYNLPPAPHHFPSSQGGG